MNIKSKHLKSLSILGILIMLLNISFVNCALAYDCPIPYWVWTSCSPEIDDPFEVYESGQYEVATNNPSIIALLDNDPGWTFALTRDDMMAIYLPYFPDLSPQCGIDTLGPYFIKHSNTEFTFTMHLDTAFYILVSFGGQLMGSGCFTPGMSCTY